MKPTVITAATRRSRRSEADGDASTSMSNHQKQTEFLRWCLRYDDTAESQLLGERIAHVQEDERRVRRGVCLMAGLAGVAVVGLCYSAVFLAYYPENLLGFTSRFITQVFCVLGLVSTVCLLVFIYLGTVYRKELDERREECRQLVTRIMESRLGRPVATARRDLRASQVGERDGRAVRVDCEAPGSPAKIESAARG